MPAQLVVAYDTRTGQRRLVPENWFDHESMSANLTREKPTGVTPRVDPNDPDAPNVAPSDAKPAGDADQPPSTGGRRNRGTTTSAAPAVDTNTPQE